MKKLILILFIVFIAAGCSNMMIDLERVELKSGETILLSGTDGADVTGKAIDINNDGTPDGIDINGDGTVDFTFIAADSSTASGLYAADTNGDGTTDIYISVSPTGISTINTATDGTGSAVTVAVSDDGTTSFTGADIPSTGTDPGTSTPAVAATTDINGDGAVDAADTAILAKLTFTLTGDTVTITGADSSISGVLNIPDSYDGKAVTSIGNEAFKDCDSLTSVTIPSSITAIGASAFGGCSELDSITMLAATAPTAASDILDGIAAPVSLSYPVGASGYDEAGTVWVDTSVILKEGDVDGDGLVDGDDATLLGKLTFTETATEATLTGNTDTSISGTLIIPAVYNGKPVTKIGSDALKDCAALTSVLIPAGITSIGDQAFQNCAALSTLYLLPTTAPTTGADTFDGITNIVTLTYPNTSTGFEAEGTPWVDTSVFHKTGDVNGDGIINNIDITLSTKLIFSITGDKATLSSAETDISGKLIIPATYEGKPVTTIDSTAFQNCTLLTSLTIPASVTEISSGAFSGCTGLTAIEMLPTTAPTAAADILDGISTPVSLTYPDGATGYDEAGTVWVNTAVVLKEGDWNADGTVNSADMDLITFSWNESGAYIQRVSTSITGSLIIPSTHDGRSLYWINDNAFEGCTSLTSVTIPESVKIIGDDAFRDCSSLTTASISEGVTTLGINVFWGCTLLSDVTLPESLLSIGEKGFYECSSLETLTLPSGMTSIGYGIFIRCISLTSINWPPLVETIADFTFSGCESLTSFEVPSTVTTLAGGAFRDCTLLTSLTIPSSVTSLGAYLIYNSPVKILTMLHSVPPSIVSTTFYELSGCTLRHPDVLTFNKDPWNNTTIFSTVDIF